MNTILSKRFDTRTLLGATLAALAPGLALAGPQGESVVAGQATVGRPDALTTLVQQTSASAVLNWSSFNVGADEFVVFDQPSSSAVVLNRVIGNGASEIFGSIAANGRVFLVNQNGVLFAPGARLDVNGLVATTFNISDDDFMDGRYAFVRGEGAPDAGVVNQGAVQTAAGGFVVLAGDFVRNDGVIVSPAGRVVLASGARATLNLDGMGLVDFAVDEATLSAAAGVTNAGQILAEGGMVVMTARVANQLVGTVVNNEGLVRASRIAEQGGELWLAAEGGDVANSGLLDASGVDGDGGRVVVVTDQDATLSGAILADGAGSGAGGEVRAIAAGTLDVAEGALISARGGPDAQSGGGMVEVSGHEALFLRGQVDLGPGGEIVIDPLVVRLTNGSASLSTGTTGFVTVAAIESQLNAGVDVKIIAGQSISASGGVTDITATGAGDLRLEIGNGSASPLCNGFGLCLEPFPAFTPVPGGVITLFGVDINIAGAFHASAVEGDLDLENVTASAIFIGTPGSRFSTIDATSLTATAGGVQLFGRDQVYVVGAVDATGGPVRIDLAGAPGGAGIVVGSVAADGAVQLMVNAPNGTANVVVNGAISGGPLVQVGAFDGSASASNTGIFIDGSITGGAIDLDAVSAGPSGYINISGGITATTGTIVIGASGHAFGSGDPAGVISINGGVAALSSLGDININAVDFNGIAGGNLTVGSIAGYNVFLGATGIGNILVGTGTGSSLAGGALTANNAQLEAIATGATGGRVLVGDANVTVNLAVEVVGGQSGGFVAFADAISSGGSVTAPATVTVGGTFDVTVTGDAGGLVVGTVSAGEISFDLHRITGVNRDIEISTGDLTVTDSGSGAGLFVTLANDGAGGATITLGNLSAVAAPVTILAHVTNGSAGDANIAIGDITGVSVHIDNEMFNNHLGSVQLGDVDAYSLNLYSRNGIIAGAIDASGGIDVAAQRGDITLGDLTAVNPGAPVSISVRTLNGVGNAITVGAITASGQRAASGGGDHGARVAIDAGYDAAAVTITGAVDITGIGRSFTDSSGGASPSYGSFTATGFFGSGNLTVHAGPMATVSFAATGGVQVTGAGGAQVEVQAGAIVAAGAIVVDATPVNVGVTGTVAYSACGSPCSVTFTETYGNFGEAQVMLSAMPMGTLGTIDVAAITVSAPRAIIEIAGRDIATGALTATGDDMHYARTSTGTIGGGAHAFSDDFFGGDAQVLIAAGSGSGAIAIGGDVAVTAPGHAGVRLGADQVQVLGSVTADASGGLFTRSGTPANPVFGEDGPFGQQLGEAPTMTEGEFTGGFADIVIGGGTGGMCSGSCGLPSAVSIDVSGNVAANAAGIAVVEINSAVTDIGGDLSAVATHGTRIGVNEGSSFDSSLGLTVAYAETIDFSGGSAQIHVQGDGVLNVGGTLTASGAFANIDLGMNSGSLGDVVVNITGGAAQFTGVYDYAGTANDYSVSFDGPGPLQGFIAGPDSGGAGAITVGNITLDAVGFGAVIVRAGSVTVGAIDVHVASADYTVFDSRVDGVPNAWTVGDAFIAVHDHTAPGAFGRATVGGAVTIDAAGDVVLLSQFDNASDVTAIHALGAVTDQVAVHIDRLNQVTCDSGSCSLGSYTPADLGLYAGTIAGDQLVDLNVSAISFGSGSLTAGGDPAVAAQFGLTGNPNGVIKSLGAVEVGFVGATGEYLVVQSGTTGAIGSASVAAGTVVQFVTGTGVVQLEQSATGAGIVNVADMAGAFMGQSAELVFGGTLPGGTMLMVGQVGPVNLAGESVTLFGPGGITGTAPLSAAAIATASGTAATVLDTTTGSLTVISASSATFDNSGFVGATALTLPASIGSLSLSTSGTLDLTGPITGGSLTFSAGTALNLNGSFTATGTLTLVTGGTFTSSGVITASSLTLDGVAGVTDFFVDTNAGAITIAGADQVAIDNSARTGATTVTIAGTSPVLLDVVSGGALTLAGTFSGGNLFLDAASLALGSGNHVATGSMGLVTGGGFSASGTLGASFLTLDGVASTDFSLSTTASDVYVAEAGAVTLDCAPAGGTLMLGFGSGTFGAVNVAATGDVALNTGITAALFALSATGDIYDNGGFLASKEGAGGPTPLPQYLLNPIDAGTVFLEAGGDILLGGASFIVGTGDGVTGVSDLALLRALEGAGIGPSQLVSNGTFLAGGLLELGDVTSAGSYLVLQGDDLVLTGAITGPSDLLVQVAPATPGNTFSVESSSPGNAATNYTFSAQLGQITARTLVIGASTLTGDATVGLNGTFDVSPMNLIIATGGAVTDIGNVTSTGIVDTLAGLLGDSGEVPVPIVDEIDPGIADPAPPVDTEAGVPLPDDGEDDEDDEGEDTGTAGADEGGDDAALITQQTMPAGICGK